MKLNKIAAILAFIIGAMAIFSGGQVIFLGKEMDYYVINWLPYYNFTLGVLSFFVTAILIWKRSRYAMLAAGLTFISHSSVMLILQTAYKDVVAPDSIRAMTIRITVWAIILILLFAQNKKTASTNA